MTKKKQNNIRIPTSTFFTATFFRIPSLLSFSFSFSYNFTMEGFLKVERRADKSAVKMEPPPSEGVVRLKSSWNSMAYSSTWRKEINVEGMEENAGKPF